MVDLCGRGDDFEYRGQVVQLDRGYPLVELEVLADSADAESVGASSSGVGSSGSDSLKTQQLVRIRCEYSANMRRDACVVGDYVRVSVPPSHDNGVILGVERRSRQLVRKDPSERAISQVLAANFDTVFIVQPIVDVNLSRLQRELVVAHQTGAHVIVLLTKADLVCETSDGASRALSCVREVAGDDVRVLAVSTKDAQSVEAVRALVPAGELAVMMGKSGAGKSSLINALVGAGARQTADVRERDGRGRHTTVNRVIVDVTGGGRVVDMPGVRGLGVWEAEKGLDAAFPDIAKMASACKFRDCTHTGEPGCRVCEAVERGEVPRARLNAYLAFAREIDVQRARKEASRRASGIKKSDGSGRFDSSGKSVRSNTFDRSKKSGRPNRGHRGQKRCHK